MNPALGRIKTGGAFGSMFFLGIMIAIIGAAAKNIGLNPYEIGLLMASQNLGFLVSVVLAGSLADVLPKTRIMAVGCAILSAALFGFFATDGFGLNVLLMFFIGAGIGVFEGVTDALLLDIHPRRPNLVINVNHFFVTFGSLAITVYLIFLQMQWRQSVVQSAVGILIFAAVFAFLPATKNRGARARLSERLSSLAGRREFPWLFGAAVCVMGVNLGTVSVLTSYLAEVRGFDQVVSKLGLVVFLSGVGLGRLAIGAFARGKDLVRVVLILFASSTVFLCTVYFFDLGPVGFPVIFLLGAATSGLLPCLFSLVGILFRNLAGTALGIVKIAIPVGGILFPALFSFLARYTSFQISLILFPVFSLTGYFIILINRRRLLTRLAEPG